MAVSRSDKPSSDHGHASPDGTAGVALAAQQKITAIAIFLGVVASIGGFMFGYVR
jgi:SP family sugar:H+ symporter-like MFS transporter